MRPDIAKVICERQRRGSTSRETGEDLSKSYGEKFMPARKHAEFEDDIDRLEFLPQREGMKIRLGYDTKRFSDRLAVIRGLIRNSLGKKWNKIHSELCRQFPPNGTTQQKHVHQHLDSYICMKTRVSSSTVEWYYGPERVYLGNAYVDPWQQIGKKHGRHDCIDGYFYYVHPITNLVCRKKVTWHSKNDRKKENAKDLERQMLKEFKSEGRLYQFIDGIWYETWMAEIKTSRPPVQLGPLYSVAYSRYDTQVVRKRQLSTKELKRFKISNAA